MIPSDTLKHTIISAAYGLSLSSIVDQYHVDMVKCSHDIRKSKSLEFVSVECWRSIWVILEHNLEGNKDGVRSSLINIIMEIISNPRNEVTDWIN